MSLSSVRCTSPAEVGLLFESASSATVLVELGTGLESELDAFDLVGTLLSEAGTREVLLLTRRGTVAHSLPQLLKMVERFPDVRLCLDFGELYFGSEALLGKWREWKRALQKLSPNVGALVEPEGGAERAHRTGGFVEYVLGLVVAWRFGWLKRELGPSVRLLPKSVQ